MCRVTNVCGCAELECDCFRNFAQVHMFPSDWSERKGLSSVKRRKTQHGEMKILLQECTRATVADYSGVAESELDRRKTGLSCTSPQDQAVGSGEDICCESSGKSPVEYCGG